MPATKLAVFKIKHSNTTQRHTSLVLYAEEWVWKYWKIFKPLCYPKVRKHYMQVKNKITTAHKTQQTWIWAKVFQIGLLTLGNIGICSAKYTSLQFSSMICHWWPLPETPHIHYTFNSKFICGFCVFRYILLLQIFPASTFICTTPHRFIIHSLRAFYSN